MNGAHFTRHGEKRAGERLAALHKSTLLRMVDKNKYVNLFTVPGLDKQYLLVYLPQLDNYWVFVYCPRVLSIITVLPIPYYNRLHANRPITADEFRAAKDLNKTTAPKFRVKLVYSYESENGPSRSAKKLWEGEIPELNGDVVKLMDKEKVRKIVLSQCDEIVELSKSDERMSKATPLYIDITYGWKSEIIQRETIYLT